MKRFYRIVEVTVAEGCWQLRLDGKPVKTPRKRHLAIHNRVLADAIAEEWRAQGDEILPQTMPLTQIADRIEDMTDEERERLAAHINGYAESDLLYYRVGAGEPLRARQEMEWEPWLRWAEQRLGVEFLRNEGIMPLAQPTISLRYLHEAVAALPPEQLVPFNILSTGFGSLILALAVLENALPVETAFTASLLEQRAQTERWGLDDEQKQRNDALHEEVVAAARFLTLLETD